MKECVVIFDRGRRILTVSLVFGGICTGVAFVKAIWPYRFWSFRLGKSEPSTFDQRHSAAAQAGIYVHILDTTQYATAATVIPRDAFSGFWKILHVDASDWNKFHLDRRNGIRLPIAPKFPLLSELADIEIENIDFSPDQIDELLTEIDLVREMNGGGLQNDVLLALSKVAIMASAAKKGLILSPFC
jgi:hypothetical protein